MDISKMAAGFENEEQENEKLKLKHFYAQSMFENYNKSV